MGRWQGKYVIGLTGNIAMGKSTIRKMLEHLGAYTIDADGLAHQVMAPGAPAYQPIVETFGKWLLDNERRIDRAKLGAVAFAHPDALSRLEGLTHPIISKGIDTLVTRATQPVVVVEAIKLIDGQLGGQVDTVWVVDTAPQIQIERLMKRGLSEQDARKRIDTQNPQREKLAKADVVISNSGAPQDTWVQVEREWNRITAARGIKVNDSVITVQTSRPVPQPAPQPVQTTAPQAKPPTQTQPAAQPGQQPTSQPIRQPTQQPAAQLNPAPSPTVTAAPPVIVTPIKRSTGSMQTVPSNGQVQQATPQPAPIQQQPQPPAQPMEQLSINIRRGMPGNAETIANLINQMTGKSLSRMDVMTAFGEKSYLLAEVNGVPSGLAGFQVENLITCMDEFLFAPNAPAEVLAEPMLKAVEEKSRELQSEVGFMFLPNSASAGVSKVFQDMGYIKMDVEQVKLPDWREAAEEAQPPNTQMWAKKLRAERVLKPL